MRYLLIAAGALALASGYAQAASVGATTNTSTFVSGGATSSGNATGTVVGTSTSVAVGAASVTPNSELSSASAVNTNHVQATTRTGLTGGVATAQGGAHGWASASAWTTP